MEHHLCILLYSKHSSSCNKLLQALSNCPVDIYNLVGINNLCIDSEQIRKQILESKNIIINSVPSILLIYPDSKIDKLEGQTVYNWIDNTVEKFLPPPPPPPPPPQLPPQLPHQQPEKEHPPLQKDIYPKNEELSEEHKELLKQLQQKQIKQNTEISTLESEEPITKPVVGIRNDAGNYDFDNDFGEEQERIINKPKEPSENKTSLMAAALAMQKERDVN